MTNYIAKDGHFDFLKSEPDTAESGANDGQLWKYDSVDKTLIDKGGNWNGSMDHWTIPKEGETGQIRNENSSLVLSVFQDTYGQDVVKQERPNNGDNQTWKRGKATRNGYFTLENPSTKKFLSNDWDELFLIEPVYPEVGDWIRKAYTNVTEVVELPLLCNPKYFNIYLTWINFFVKFVIPTIILVGCNIRILSEVKKIHRQVASFSGNKSDKKKELEARLASMISTVVIVFVLCNSFESIVFILSTQEMISIDVVQEYLRPLADLLLVINSGINVAIYCGYNSDFREKFVQMYLTRRSKGPTTGGNTLQLNLIRRRDTQTNTPLSKESQETTL